MLGAGSLSPLWVCDGQQGQAFCLQWQEQGVARELQLGALGWGKALNPFIPIQHSLERVVSNSLNLLAEGALQAV